MKKYKRYIIILSIVLIGILTLNVEVLAKNLGLKYFYDSVLTTIMDKSEKVPVLMYHHILKEKEIIEYDLTGNNSIISLEEFKKQMDYLHKNNFHTLELSELKKFVIEGKKLPEKSILITFDDGYLSNAEYAYPIMKDYSFKGAIFMMGKVSEREPVEFSPSEISFLSNKELQDYRDVFEYASHTYNMHLKVDDKPLLTTSSIDELEEDIKRNTKLYETDSIAYPYGAYNRTVIKTFINKGYKLGFTTKPGYVNRRSNAMKLNRFGINPNTSIEEFKDIINGEFN